MHLIFQKWKNKFLELWWVGWLTYILTVLWCIFVVYIIISLIIRNAPGLIQSGDVVMIYIYIFAILPWVLLSILFWFYLYQFILFRKTSIGIIEWIIILSCTVIVLSTLTMTMDPFEKYSNWFLTQRACTLIWLIVLLVLLNRKNFTKHFL